MDLLGARGGGVRDQGHAVAQAEAVEEGGAQAEGQLGARHREVRDALAAQDQVQLREHEGAEARLDDAVLARLGLQARDDAHPRRAGHDHVFFLQGGEARDFDVRTVGAVFAHDVEHGQPQFPEAQEHPADGRDGGVGPGHFARTPGHGEIVLHVDDEQGLVHGVLPVVVIAGKLP